MKRAAEGRARILAVAVLLAMSLAVSLPAAAQVTTTKPIKVKGPKVQTEKLYGLVVHWTPVSVTIHDKDDFNRVRTLSFSEALQHKVQDRYLENGDPLTVYVVKGSDTAVKLRGRLRRQEPAPRVLK